MHTTRKLRAAPTRVQNNAPTPGLASDEAELFEDMLSAFANNRENARRYVKSSVLDALHRVREFVAFARKPPWRCTGEDFENWCRELVQVRKVRVRSERKYQGEIRGFYEYIVGNARFRNVVRMRFDCELEQICTQDNCIPHHQDEEPLHGKFSGRDLEQFFGFLDRKLAELVDPRWPPRTRQFLALARDRALFFLMMCGSLRVSEALGIDVGGFEPAEALPDAGEFAAVRVTGKGHKGSGAIPRTVPLDNPEVAPVIERYIANVRPYLLSSKNPDERALFLSEKGTRLTRCAAWRRLKSLVAEAGLDVDRYATHSLRRTGITADAILYGDAKVAGAKAGQRSLAVTQRYLHLSIGYVKDVVSDAYAKRYELLKKSPLPKHDKGK